MIYYSVLIALFLGTLSFDAAAAARSQFEICLEPGWNLVSVPERATSDQLKHASMRGVFWQWDDGVYTRATALEPDRGYWLFSRTADCIQIDGTGEARDLLPGFDDGWNLISVGGDVTVTMAELRVLEERLGAVWGYREGRFRTAQDIDPLRGFWAYRAPLHTLTVVGGTDLAGTGEYVANTQIDLQATAQAGKVFAGWVADFGGSQQSFSDPGTVDTTFTMPPQDTTVTAVWRDPILTVVNGTGSGSYVVGTVVAITAAAAPPAHDFGSWTGDSEHLVDNGSMATTLTMPNTDITVRAHYTLDPQADSVDLLAVRDDSSSLVAVLTADTGAFVFFGDRSAGLRIEYAVVVLPTGERGVFSMRDGEVNGFGWTSSDGDLDIELEPNNTSNDAQLILPPTTIAGTLEDDADTDDVFRFIPAETGIFDIDLNVFGNQDVDLFLFSDGGETYSSATTSAESLTPVLTAGKAYLLDVFAFDTGGGAANYEVSVVHGSPSVEVEPNDVGTAGQTVRVPLRISGHLDGVVDESDSFTFVARETGAINVTVDDMGANDGTVIVVRNSFDTVIAQSLDPANLSTVTFDVSRGQTYTVDLYAVDFSSASFDYVVDIRPVRKVIEQPGDEPNGELADANLVTLPITVLGAINASTDRFDTYRITPPASSWYRATVTGFGDGNDNDIDLFVVDEDSVQLAQSVDTAPTESVVIELTGGDDYFFIVKAFATNGVRQYTIDLAAVPAPDGGRGGARSDSDLFSAVSASVIKIVEFIDGRDDDLPTISALASVLQDELNKPLSDPMHSRYFLDQSAGYALHEARDLANWFRGTLNKTLYPPEDANLEFSPPSADDLRLMKQDGGEIAFTAAIPTAAFTTALDSGFAPAQLQLAGSTSTALGGIRSFLWTLDRGLAEPQQADGEFAMFQLDQAGSYTIRLTVTSNDRVAASTERIITVDTPPEVVLAGGPLSIVEPPPTGEAPASASALFTVQLSKASDREVRVTLAGDGTAAVGSDYQFRQNDVATSTIVIPAGQTSASVTVRALFDGQAEGDESGTVQINSATGAEIGVFLPVSMTVHDD